MTFRQPAKLLSHMAEMVEVISTDRLNPVCFERFEPEDVRIHPLVISCSMFDMHMWTHCWAVQLSVYVAFDARRHGGLVIITFNCMVIIR